jgi:pimeloyl-ACP methyl ester carboxylesterase
MDLERIAAEPCPAATWDGVKAIRSGKGYVNAPMGQLHYRDVGPRDSGRPDGEPDRHPLLLFHQCPQNLIEFAEVQNSLALLGLRSIAADLPGYGMSDQPDFWPTVGAFADNFVALMDALSLQTVVAGGHHTGAAVAAALAARHPSRVSGVILHGLPLYTREEAEGFRNKVLWDCTPMRDGSHMSQLFKWSRTGTPQELINLTWMSVGLFMQGRDVAHWAVNNYDMESDLRRIRSPGIIVSEVDDMTHPRDKRAWMLRPDFRYHEVSTPGNAMLMGEPARWAAIARTFVDAVAGLIPL